MPDATRTLTACSVRLILSVMLGGVFATTSTAQTASVSFAAPIRISDASPTARGTFGAVAWQTVVNPTTLEFTASPDHGATANGVAVVTSYLLELLAEGTTTVAASRDLGKPAPTSNVITFSQWQAATSTLKPGNSVAVVSAVGPGGATRSAPSVPFSVAVRAPAAPGTPVIRQ